MKLEWDGTDAAVLVAVEAHMGRILRAIKSLAAYLAVPLEDFMKEHAPWEDQSGEARRGLNVSVEDTAKEIVTLWLAHGKSIFYGVFLETRNAGEYAILWPTIEAHASEIQRMLQEVFG
jgi:hypothetical protein